MKRIWIGFGLILILLLVYKAFFGTEEHLNTIGKRTSLDGRDEIFHDSSAIENIAFSPALGVLEGNYVTKADSIVAFALQRYGAEYSYGGVTEEGFDCSGFTTYVFQKFNIRVPHGSALQSTLGESVPLAQARKGDLIIFTGTDVQDRTPGHVGIVITHAPKAVQFVHSSSNGGVKVNEVEGTLYQERFLDVRRVLP